MDNCEHKYTSPKYDYVVCHSCGRVKTDSHRDWGIAKNKWFKSLDVARFYMNNGRIPEEYNEPE